MRNLSLGLCFASVLGFAFLSVSDAGADDKGTATIKGKVAFEGEAPKRKKLKMESEPVCDEQHGGEAQKEDVIVNENKTLRNVIVFVEKGLEGKKFDPTATPVVLDQSGCMYKPHVIGVMLGQKLLVRNSDPVTHNIHGLPKMNSEFNFGQNQKGQENPIELTTAEVMIKVKCDVHPWMACYIGVFEHPFFSVTGEDGTYTLSGLPAGDYTIKAWHEGSKTGWTQSVKVGDGESKDADFTVKAEEIKS